MIKHIAVALAIQAALWLALDDLLVGAIAASFGYFMREHAQVEYWYMTNRGLNRSTAPWYMGFLRDAWTRKGMLDWVGPTVITFGVYFALGGN